MIGILDIGSDRGKQHVLQRVVLLAGERRIALVLAQEEGVETGEAYRAFFSYALIAILVQAVEQHPKFYLMLSLTPEGIVTDAEDILNVQYTRDSAIGEVPITGDRNGTQRLA